MKWSSVVSEQATLSAAVDECASAIFSGLGERSPDLVLAFVSPHYASEHDALPGLVRDRLGAALLLGCSGQGVIGGGREVEHRPGVAMVAAHLPGVEITGFHIDGDGLPDGDAPPDAWKDLVNAPDDEAPGFLLLVDPFSVRSEDLLTGLDYAYPRSAKIGGLVSGATQPGGNALFLGDEIFRDGVVGLAVHGDIAVDTVVAQGCRPIGEPMLITACRQNVLLELDGKSALETLKELIGDLSERDRELAGHSLFLGVVMDQLKENPDLGDFLIRAIVGADPREGALAIGEMLSEGHTVQFHLRDADTSSQDLEAMLTAYVGENSVPKDAGVLLFSCLGRGSFLYQCADHDTDMFRDKVGDMPLSGFFCNGEIGPVRGSTFLHTYTSSFGILRPRG